MISLETVKRLKDAGIRPRWAMYSANQKVIPEPLAVFQFREGAEIWAADMETKPEPFYTLDQLLAKIERQGYAWEMGLTVLPGGPMMPGNQKIGYWCEIFKDYQMVHSVKSAGSRSDAVGEALLWIAERKAESERKRKDGDSVD